MKYEDIVLAWKQGHSKQWLFKKEYESMKYLSKNNGGNLNESELRYNAQHNVEQALIRFWKEMK